MEIGVSLPQNSVGRDLIAIRDFAQAVEQLGYNYLSSGDHVLGEDPAGFAGRPGPYTVDFIWHEPFVMFGYIAALTTRLRFLTSVFVLPQRQTVLVAKQAAELDWMSQGRLMLGVGVGWNPLEYQALNEQFDNRGSRMIEQFEVMRRLWTEDTVTFHGRYHHIERSGLNPRPVQQPIPLWIGGNADAVLKRTGRIADGWIGAIDPGEDFQPDVLRERWEVVKAAAKEAGRDPSTVGLHARVGTDTRPDEARKQLDAWREMGATLISVGTPALSGGPAAYIEAIERYQREVLS